MRLLLYRARNVTNVVGCKFHSAAFRSYRGISCENYRVRNCNIPTQERVLKGRITSVVPSVNFHQQLVKEISFDDSRLKKHLDVIFQTYNNAKERCENGQEQERNRCKRTMLELQPLVSVMKELETVKSEIRELDVLVSELEKQEEKELVKIAGEDRDMAQSKLELCKEKILQLVIPVDEVDNRDIVIELNAGVGGQEAMLFVKDLYQMYCNFADYKGWKWENLKYDCTDIGGLREAHVSISGFGAYQALKLESGVHRVQRVPKTERSGRIHTSTATVAVLPQPNDIDIIIKPQDLKVEFKRSSGAGGQHVNKTDSCVRLTHVPTGIVAECQMERCQHRNRALALTALRTKLYQRELDSITKSTQESRKVQVGTAGRSEKVRTFNFAQNRITDHRLQQSVFHIDEFLQGTEKLDYFIKNLKWWWSVQLLQETLRKYN